MLVALGAALDAVHNYIRRKSEYRAYKDGYKQAQKEESIRNATREQIEERRRKVELLTLSTPVETHENVAQFPPARVQITDQFMRDLHENGKATTRLR